MKTAAPATVEVDDQDDAAPASGLSRLTQRFIALQSGWLLIALAVIVTVFSVMRPEEFPTAINFRNIALDASILLLMTVGMTYVIITAGIDLSVGSVLVFSQVVAAQTMSSMAGGDGVWVSFVGLAVSLACGLAWGVLNGVLITKLGVPPLIATLGSLGAAQGAALLMTNGVNVTGVPEGLVTGVGNGLAFGQVPWLVIISVAVTVAFGLVLAKTQFGRYTYAVGSNTRAAERAGINIDRHLIRIYGLSGLLAGFAGFLSLARFASTVVGGHTSDNLNVVAAVVIGGTSLFGGVGTIFGSAVGVFIPAVLQTGLVMVGLQPFWQQIAVAIVLVVAVYIDQLRRRRRPRR